MAGHFCTGLDESCERKSGRHLDLPRGADGSEQPIPGVHLPPGDLWYRQYHWPDRRGLTGVFKEVIRQHGAEPVPIPPPKLALGGAAHGRLDPDNDLSRGEPRGSA